MWARTRTGPAASASSFVTGAATARAAMAAMAAKNFMISTIDVIDSFLIIIVQTSKTATMDAQSAIEVVVGEAVLRPFAVVIRLGTS